MLRRRSERSELARFRRWYRRSLWRDADASLTARARLLKRRLLRPYRMTLNARIAAARWAPLVERHAGIPRRRQLLTMYVLAVVHGFPPEIYYRYRLFEEERRKQAPWYLHWDEHNRVLAMLVEHRTPVLSRQLEDKRSFVDWCEANGLPTHPIVAVFIDGRMDATGDGLPLTDLFVKPADGRGGAGAEAWSVTAAGSYCGSDGGVVSPEALVAELACRSREAPYVAQERLHNHRELSALSGRGLCTIRVVTGKPPGGAPVVLSATFGMPMGRSQVDNLHAGGICAAIDEVSGQLSAGARVFADECVTVYDKHPDTGGSISGVVLPHWAEVKELALRAHRVADGLAFVGWDIAFGDSGPLLIEANTVWDAAMPQIPSGQPLGRTAYLPWLLQHLAEPGPKLPVRSE